MIGAVTWPRAMMRSRGLLDENEDVPGRFAHVAVSCNYLILATMIAKQALHVPGSRGPWFSYFGHKQRILLHHAGLVLIL
mmetsp:Transcript_4708/g.8388  ORF Transcript_4708/g.8388 Transcript_4708/m.8388 type:complete len:80 (+) Transcript_4708:485-724(+)